MSYELRVMSQELQAKSYGLFVLSLSERVCKQFYLNLWGYTLI